MASWKATGLLEKHWSKVGGRDRLADITGIQPGTLSGYNTGRLKLGEKNAVRIAAALNVSIFDLGATAPGEAEQEQTVLERLAQLEAAFAESLAGQAKLARALATIEGRVARLEDQGEPGRDAAGGQM